MSKRDGELVKAILLSAAAKAAGELHVLEWGSGQSTVSFTRILQQEQMRFHWLTLEYDRKFFGTVVAPELLGRPDTVLRFPDDGGTVAGSTGEGKFRVEAVCWNRTKLRPVEHLLDRLVDLDEYVDYPSTTEYRYDVMIVDGRMRRRCLLVAAELLGPGALVLLHDAWHRFYHCALGRYPASEFFGDELWAGASSQTLLDEVLRDLR
jgi:hypothetical protein